MTCAECLATYMQLDALRAATVEHLIADDNLSIVAAPSDQPADDRAEEMQTRKAEADKRRQELEAVLKR